MNDLDEKLTKLCLDGKAKEVPEKHKGIALYMACLYDKCDMMEKLINKFVYSTADITANNNLLLKTALGNNNLTTANMLLLNFSIPYERSILCHICKQSCETSLKFYVEYYELTRVDILSTPALEIACRHGKFGIIDYLQDTFQLIAESGTPALAEACRNGSNHMAKYLIFHGVKQHPSHRDLYVEMLRHACEINYDLVVTLVDSFGLNALHIDEGTMNAIRRSVRLYIYFKDKNII